MTTIKTLLASMESRQWLLLSAVIFRLVLELTYRNFVSPFFSYAGFVLEVNQLKYFESWVLFFAFLLMLKPVLKRPSEFFMALLIFSNLTPLLVLYALSDASRSHLLSILLGILLINIFRQGRSYTLPFIRHSKLIAISLLVVGAAAVTFWMIYSGGLRFFNLDLSKVYEFRRDAGEVINQGLMGYVNSWAGKVFGPTLIAFALWKKKYWLFLIMFSLHVIWFAVSANKSVLLYPFLVSFLWVWFRHTRAISLVPIGMSFAVLVAYSVYLISDEIFVASMFIRRVFFLPAHLSLVYYDYFSANEFVYWSNSVASSFVDYPYDLKPPLLIGVYDGTDSHANTSFVATGYMHAGIVGVVFYGIAIGLLLRLIDIISLSGIPLWFAIAVMIVPIRSLLVSADLPPALLTHGVFVALFFLFLLRSRWEVGRESSTPTPLNLPSRCLV